jgi:hypothetical protein
MPLLEALARPVAFLLTGAGILKRFFATHEDRPLRAAIMGSPFPTCFFDASPNSSGRS